MLFSKPSKKSNKTAELSATPVSEQAIPDSKPAKRTKSSSAAAISTPKPKQAPHRHSKLSSPATPIIEEVAVTEAVVATAAPLSAEEVSRLAFTFWEERNYAHGFAEEDWHRAEKALSATAG